MSVSQDQISVLEDNIKRDGIQKIVVGAVVRRDDLILLLKRRADDFMGDLVELPSGMVDVGESIVDALKREVEEETGLIINEIEAFIGAFDYTSGSGKKTRQLNFLTYIKSGEVKLNPTEHVESYWLNPDAKEFESLNISEKTKRIIKITETMLDPK